MQVSFKEINKLAIPAIIAGVSEPLIGLVDTAIIKELGDVQLAGVVVATSLLSLMIWVLSQSKSAISALVSKYHGANKRDEIASLVPQTFVFNLLVGIISGGAVWLLMTQIFEFYGATDAYIGYAERYTNIRIIGIPITLATYGLFGVLRGVQNTKWAMQISLAGGLLNLLLDVILVFGVSGVVDSMGVEGAAIASLCAQGLMLLLTIIVVYRKTEFRLKWVSQLNKELSTFFRMFVNFFLRTLALNLAYFLAVKFNASYGLEQVAAHGISANIWVFTAFFIDGYANAGNAIAGKLKGEKRYTDLWLLGGTISKLSVGVGVMLGVVLGMGYYVIGDVFSPNAEVKEMLMSMFWLVVLIQPINGIAFGLDGIFKGLGEAAFLRNVLFISTFVVFIPSLFLFDFLELDIYGVWYTFNLWMMARAGLLVYRFLKDYKQYAPLKAES